MKTTEKLTTEQQLCVLRYAYDTLRAKGIVTSQKDFAELIGSNPKTLSSALANRGGYLTDKLARRVAAKALEYGVDAFNQQIVEGGSTQVQGDHNQIGIEPKKFSHEADWFILVSEKDRQIDRLLTIIEKMQK